VLRKAQDTEHRTANGGDPTRLFPTYTPTHAHITTAITDNTLPTHSRTYDEDLTRNENYTYIAIITRACVLALSAHRGLSTPRLFNVI